MELGQAKNASRAFAKAAARSLEPRPLPDGNIEALVVPAVTCYAFAIELGLKSLLLDAGKPTKGHNLQALFEELPLELQKELRDATDFSQTDFARRLADSARLFVDWRYIHEQPSATADLNFLRAFNDAVARQLSE